MKMRVIRFDRKTSRVFRGGCWNSIPVSARVAYRGWISPGDRDTLGFRTTSIGVSL